MAKRKKPNRAARFRAEAQRQAHTAQHYIRCLVAVAIEHGGELVVRQADYELAGVAIADGLARVRVGDDTITIRVDPGKEDEGEPEAAQ